MSSPPPGSDPVPTAATRSCKPCPSTRGTDAQVGIWECEPGGWPVVDRPNTETCYIISGRARLTDDETGTKSRSPPAISSPCPPGWTGRWDVIETIRKAYAIF